LPQATSNLFSKKFSSIIILSIIIGFAAMISGLIVSYYTDLPSGATIIVILTIIFIIAKGIEVLISRKIES
jgi:zinc transport system permease protein